MNEHELAREQREHWNGPGGARWVNEQARLDRVLAPLGALGIVRAAPRAGERAIDVGCGCGASALELGQRVGASGAVLGIDISGPMLARARERAAAMPWVRFVEADATDYAFGSEAQLVFSRFGSMFFAQPALAFANLHRALAPRGRLCLLVWRRFEDNEWGRVPLQAALTVLGPQPPPPPPGSPGPFSLADAERVRALLQGAGFHDVTLEPDDRMLEVSNSGLDEAVSFCLQAGPAARVLIGADPDTIARVSAVVRVALEPYADGQRVALGSGCWVVTAVK